MADEKHIPLSNYSDGPSASDLFYTSRTKLFSCGFQFGILRAKGWSSSVDRFRFHFESADLIRGSSLEESARVSAAAYPGPQAGQ